MSMPQGGGSGQSWEAGPGADPAGTPQGQPHQQPQYQQPQYGQAPPGQQPPGINVNIGGAPVSPLEAATRVTGKRVVQYILDVLIAGIVGSAIYFALSWGHGALGAILLLVAVLAVVAWYFLYWVYMPYRSGGQTLGMKMLGVRIVSLDGGRASMGQLFGRALLLIVDGFFWGLVGLITMVSSRYRQRVGDHAANTMVIRADAVLGGVPQAFAGAGQAGSR